MAFWTHGLWFVMDEHRTFKTSGFDAASRSEAHGPQNHVNILKFDALCIITHTHSLTHSFNDHNRLMHA